VAGRSSASADRVVSAAAQVLRVRDAVSRRRGAPAVTAEEILDALTTLRWLQKELAAAEPTLIAAARERGSSWQVLAGALGVASRQAAERRYLRSAPAAQGTEPATRDARVQAARDRRAVDRAVDQWANDHRAHLRGLAGQIAALTDLDAQAAADLGRLHHALGDADATALPSLLAKTHGYLGDHPHLADQVARVEAKIADVRRATERRRGRRRAQPPSA